MSNIDKQQIRDDIAIRKSMPCFGFSPDHSLARLKAIQETQRSFGLEVVGALLDELEAREVTLPPTFWYEHDELPREIPVLDKRLVKKALRDAGVKVVAAVKGEAS